MEPEVLFIKYAFPCAFVIKQRGEIDEKGFRTLEDASINDKVLDRALLEKIFFRAFERIDKVAKEMKSHRWDAKVIREYFVRKHNEIIDQGMYSYAKAPESLKNLCKVHVATVKRVSDRYLVVGYGNGRTRTVMSDLVRGIKEGDKVTIHYGYAVEKVQS